MSDSNRLRIVRAEQRVSQLALALRAGINPTRVWRIENGYAMPTEGERNDIACALGVAGAAIWPPDEERTGATNVQTKTASHRG